MKLSKFKKYIETPFDVDVKTRNKGVASSKVGDVYSRITGEMIHDNVSIVVHKSVDKEEFVKLFFKGIPLMLGVDSGDIKVFLYLLYNLEINTGKAFFEMSRCIANVGFQKPWIYRSLGRLCKNGFIARTENSKYYWINQSIAFNGSRLSIKKPSTEEENV